MPEPTTTATKSVAEQIGDKIATLPKMLQVQFMPLLEDYTDAFTSNGDTKKAEQVFGDGWRVAVEGHTNAKSQLSTLLKNIAVNAKALDDEQVPAEYIAGFVGVHDGDEPHPLALGIVNEGIDKPFDYPVLLLLVRPGHEEYDTRQLLILADKCISPIKEDGRKVTEQPWPESASVYKIAERLDKHAVWVGELCPGTNMYAMLKESDQDGKMHYLNANAEETGKANA